MHQVHLDPAYLLKVVTSNKCFSNGAASCYHAVISYKQRIVTFTKTPLYIILILINWQILNKLMCSNFILKLLRIELKEILEAPWQTRYKLACFRL